MIRLLLTTTAVAALLAGGAMAQQAPANNAAAPANGMTPANSMAAPANNAMAPANNAMAPAGNAAAPANNAKAPAGNAMAPAGNAAAPAGNAMAPANANTTMPATSAPATAAPANATVTAPANATVAAPANVTVTAPANVTVVAPANTTVAAPANVTVTAPANGTAAAPAGMVVTQPYSAIAGDDLASRIMGSTVYNSTADNAETIGDINDLVVNNQGQVAAVVIGVGGFLGIGEKNVAVNYDDLQWSQAADGTYRYVLNTTADALTAAPDFVFQDENDQAGANNSRNNAVVDTAPVNNATANTTGNNAAGATNSGNRPAANNNAGAVAANGPDRTAMKPVSIGTMTTDDLDGIDAYGVNNEKLGEIGDIVLNAQGKIDAVIIDVGGFLGIGKKPVAVGVDNLNVSQDQNNKRYLFLNVTRDQLDKQPAFNRDTYATDRAAQRLMANP